MFRRDDIALRFIQRCGIDTNFMQSIYYMWKFNLAGKENALREYIEIRKTYKNFPIVEMIGLTTPEMRLYIINEILIYDEKLRNSDLGIYLLGINGERQFTHPTMRYIVQQGYNLFEYKDNTYKEILALLEPIDRDRLNIISTIPFINSIIINTFRRENLPYVLSFYSNILLMKMFPHLISWGSIKREQRNLRESNNSHTILEGKTDRMTYFGIIPI